MRVGVDSRQHEIRVAQTCLRRIHEPLVRDLADRAAGIRGRFVVLIAGPPGSGKSTLASLWVAVASGLGLSVPFQALPMDGFHLPNRELERRSAPLPDGTVALLWRFKGIPETYDFDQLHAALGLTRSPAPLGWPMYDRTLHDPVPDAVAVIPHGVLLVEGNFLLLNEPGWRDLRDSADRSIFIECGRELTANTVFQRFVEGGRDPADARRHLEEVDIPNWRRVMAGRPAADIVIRVGRRRGLSIIHNRSAECLAQPVIFQ